MFLIKVCWSCGCTLRKSNQSDYEDHCDPCVKSAIKQGFLKENASEVPHNLNRCWKCKTMYMSVVWGSQISCKDCGNWSDTPPKSYVAFMQDPIGSTYPSGFTHKEIREHDLSIIQREDELNMIQIAIKGSRSYPTALFLWDPNVNPFILD